MVYRALDMEGFTAIEGSDSILIVPADQETKMNLSPALMAAGETAVPGGRQRLVKVFALQHLPGGGPDREGQKRAFQGRAGGDG